MAGGARRSLRLTGADVRTALGVVAVSLLPVLAVLTVLVAVLAAVLADDGQGSGSLADWLRTAVLVLALSLGGRAVLDGSVTAGEFGAQLSATLRVLPLTITLVVLVLAGWSSARAERTGCSKGPAHLLARAGLTGLTAGLVAALLAGLSRASTVYGEDLGEALDSLGGAVSLGAGVPGTFVGATVALTLAAVVGRLAATPGGPARPWSRPVPGWAAELGTALRVLRTWAVGLLIAAVLALVLCWVYEATLTDDLDGGRLGSLLGLLFLGINAVLALALAGLGVPLGLEGRAFGSTTGLADLADGGVAQRSFDLVSEPVLLLLFLVPGLLAVGAAVRRSLRAPAPSVTRATLQAAAACGAVAGLLAALAVRISFSGSAGGSAGILGAAGGVAEGRVGPSLLWAPLLGAVWATAVVSLVRCGPTLALSLPVRVSRMVAGRAVRPEWSAALAGTTPAPAGRRSGAVRITATAAGGLLVLAVLGAGVIAVLNATVSTPKAAAEDYLGAVAAGDVAAVTSALPDGAITDGEPLLDGDVLGSDDFTPIDDVRIEDVHRDGDTATVEVTYTVDGTEQQDSLFLVTGEARWGVLSTWQVGSSLPVVELGSGGVLGMEIGGQDVADGTYQALPGQYTVHAAQHELLTAEDTDVVVTGDLFGAVAQLQPVVRDDVEDEVRALVDERVTACVAATATPLTDCPFLSEDSWWAPELTDAHIQITTKPVYVVEYDDYSGELRVETAYPGELSVTGTETYESSFGGEPYTYPYDDELSFDVDGVVTARGGELVLEWDSY